MNASIKETHNLPINWFRCPNLLAHIGHILFLGTAQPIELVAVFIFTTLNGLEMVKHCTLVAHFHHKHTRLAREQHPGENSETHPSYLSAISERNACEHVLAECTCLSVRQFRFWNSPGSFLTNYGNCSLIGSINNSGLLITCVHKVISWSDHIEPCLMK
jgi:hypothetical protein